MTHARGPSFSLIKEEAASRAAGAAPVARGPLGWPHRARRGGRAGALAVAAVARTVRILRCALRAALKGLGENNEALFWCLGVSF